MSDNVDPPHRHRLLLGLRDHAAVLARHTTITHNDLYDLPYTGITAGVIQGHVDQASHPQNSTNINADNTISDNLIHDYLKVRADGGAIYVEGHQAHYVYQADGTTIDPVQHPGPRPAGDRQRRVRRRNAYFAYYDDAGSEWINWQGNVAFERRDRLRAGRLQPDRPLLDHRQLLLRRHPVAIRATRRSTPTPAATPTISDDPRTGRRPQQPVHRGRRDVGVLGTGRGRRPEDLLRLADDEFDDPGADRRRGIQFEHTGLRGQHAGQRRPVPVRWFPDRARPGRHPVLPDIGRHAVRRPAAQRHRPVDHL